MVLFLFVAEVTIPTATAKPSVLLKRSSPIVGNPAYNSKLIFIEEKLLAHKQHL